MNKMSLVNGYYIPDRCYGTGITYRYGNGISGKLKKIYNYALYFFKSDKEAKKTLQLPKMIKIAVESDNGCFDTSRAYGKSEQILGDVLKKYDREKYYIITKLDNKSQYSDRVRESFEDSLRMLQVDYIDLYLMHWPVKEKFLDSWKIMEDLYYEGKCKAIGVSNFNIHHLEELKKAARVNPVVNEIECHPLFTQNELIEYCKLNGIRVVAYTATGRMDERLGKTCLTELAKKYNKSVSQIIMKWHMQRAIVPIVNTYSKIHLIENLSLDDFVLTQKEVEAINGININSRLRYDPDNCDFSKL